MKIDEYLAWFVGFSEHIKRRPTAQQWARIVDTTKKIEGDPPFKAWFDGFTAHLKGTPGADDWRKMTARVREEQARAQSGKRRGIGDLFKSFEQRSKDFVAAPHLKDIYLKGKRESES